MKKEQLINVVNLPKHIANHVAGKTHTKTHRRIAGIFVMLFGVAIAHIFKDLHLNILLGLIGDLFGHSIEATGFLPFVHEIEKISEEQNN